MDVAVCRKRDLFRIWRLNMESPQEVGGGGQFYQTLGKHKFSPTPVGALPNGALKFFIFLREAKGFLG